MLHKQQLTDRRRAALVIKARAGLICASDDIEAERRARMERTSRIGRCVKTYVRCEEYGSEGPAITDILADLRHYCDTTGLEFDELDSAASDQYLEEVAYPCRAVLIE